MENKNFLKRFAGVFKRSLTDVEPNALEALRGGRRTRTLTGVRVSETTAMNYSAVYACVRIISETIASLPLNVYKRLDIGKRKATEHPLYKVLHLKPNDDMTSFTWRELMATQLNLNGNSYNYKLRDGYGIIRGFMPLLANRMEVTIGDNDEVKYNYEFKDGIKRQVPKEDILHIPGLSFNGIVGRSPISMAREAIGLGMALEEFGSRFFSNSTNIGGVAQHPGKLTKQGYENLRSSINEVYQGLGKSHSLLLLEEGMKYEKITIPPNDAQFIESRRFQLEEIARIFRIPKHLLQDLMNASFSNIEHQSIDFVVHTIRPWLVRIEQAINADDEIFSDKDYFCEFVVDGLLRGDTSARSEYYVKMIQNGVYSPNDVLEMENKNAYPGGDKHFIQLNMQTVESIGSARAIKTEIKTVDKQAGKTDKRNKSIKDMVANSYRPLFLNAFIRIINREKTDITKILTKENYNGELEKFMDKHNGFVGEQLKPCVFSFVEALTCYTSLTGPGAGIFSDEYLSDLTSRYILDLADKIDSLKQDIDSFTKYLEDKPEEISGIEIKSIVAAFDKYVKKTGAMWNI